MKLFEEEDKGTLEEAVVLQNLGTVCNYQHDWKTSIAYHKRAADVYHQFASLPLEAKAAILPKAGKITCILLHARTRSDLNNF